MKIRILVIQALVCLLLCSLLCFGAVAADSNDEHVKAALIADTNTIIPNKDFRLGVQLTMSPGWHTYYKEPGEAGLATKIIWNLPPGFKSGPLIWEIPEKFSDAGITTYGYIGKTLIATQITPPEKLPVGKNLIFSANVEWLGCKDLCVPGHAKIQLTLRTADGSVVQRSSSARSEFDVLANNFSNQEQGAGYSSFLICFVFAFLGGILLNFMPCVLPVVVIKVLSLLEQTSKESARATTTAFAAGIFSSFLFLGLLVIGLQAAGHQVGWGFQFQQPIFLMFMSVLVLLFALSLFGLLELSVSVGQKEVDKLAERRGLSGDFFKGVLATILSTPCTAPFLGTALGFAFVQPWSTTLTIFAAVGAGMCLPYIVLIIAPGYIKFLPKPGVWMEKLKEAFGFILLATTIWLVSVLAGQIGNDQLIGFVYFLLIMAFAVWLMNRFANLASSYKRIVLVRATALAIVLTAAYFCLLNKPVQLESGVMGNAKPDTIQLKTIEADSFNIGALNQALSSGKTVFLDFSARWCLTCQVNESTALNTEAVQNKMHDLHVVFMKADWTKQDPTITALLKKFGRSGVPLYVIFPGKNPKQPIILPELITQQIVLDKLSQAGASQN